MSRIGHLTVHTQQHTGRCYLHPAGANYTTTASGCTHPTCLDLWFGPQRTLCGHSTAQRPRLSVGDHTNSGRRNIVCAVCLRSARAQRLIAAPAAA